MLITWVTQCCHPIKKLGSRWLLPGQLPRLLIPTQPQQGPAKHRQNAKTMSLSSFQVMTRLLKLLKVNVGLLKFFIFYWHLILTAGPSKKARVVHSPEPASPAAVPPQQPVLPAAVQREQHTLPAVSENVSTAEEEDQPYPVNRNLDIDAFFDPPTVGEKGKNRCRRCKGCA